MKFIAVILMLMAAQSVGGSMPNIFQKHAATHKAYHGATVAKVLDAASALVSAHDNKIQRRELHRSTRCGSALLTGRQSAGEGSCRTLSGERESVA